MTRVKFVLDRESGIWHSDNLHDPGAAGVIAFDMFGGQGRIEGIVDRIHVQRLVALDVHTESGLQLADSARGPLARLFGEGTDDLFRDAARRQVTTVEVRADEGALEGAVEAHGRLPRIMDEIDALERDAPNPMLGLLFLEAALEGAAVSSNPAPLLEAATALLTDVAPAPIAVSIPTERAAAISARFADLAHALQVGPHPARYGELVEWLDAWQQELGRQHKPASSDSSWLAVHWRNYYARIRTRGEEIADAVRGSLSFGTMAPALGLRTSLSGDIGSPAQSWQSVTMLEAPEKLRDLGVQQGETQARLLPSSGGLELRTRATNEDFSQGLWVRVFDSERETLALGQFGADAEGPSFGMVARLSIPSGMTPTGIELTRDPSAWHDRSPSYRFQSTSFEAREALRLERLGLLDEAASAWLRCAAHWHALGAGAQSHQAVSWAINALRRNGYSAEQQLNVVRDHLRTGDFDPGTLQNLPTPEREPEEPLLADYSFADPDETSAVEPTS